MAQKKFPIGVQDFKKLIEGGYCYVDKTDVMYQLVHSGTNAFLGRPRRFGKSLLCTTLKYYFEGERELFRGLKIYELEQEWVKRPVLHLELNQGEYTSAETFRSTLNRALCAWEQLYGSDKAEESLSARFAGVMRRAHEQTGHKVAVLVDEYDKPLLEAMHDREMQDDFRRILKSFYGTMKSSDADIQFIFLTGVTKFSKVSVFSDLNNMKDVSMDDEYAAICGITTQELDSNFHEDIERLAQRGGCTYEAMRNKLRKVYDGYHFSPCMLDVYNPFSLLRALDSQRIEYYWFATGTPTFLTYLLRKAGYDLTRLSGVEATAERLGDISEPEQDAVPILFQSGYLTIKDYDPRFGNYTLDFPNREVREGFFNALLPQYGLRRDIDGNSFSVSRFVRAVERGDIDGFMEALQAFLANYEVVTSQRRERSGNIPYTQATEERRQRVMEQQYQNVVYIIFTLMGFYCEVEHHTARGRIDLVVKTPLYIYVMEFKVGSGTAQEALQQINDRQYAAPYLADTRTLMKVGIGFDPKTQCMDEWVVEAIS